MADVPPTRVAAPTSLMAPPNPAARAAARVRRLSQKRVGSNCPSLPPRLRTRSRTSSTRPRAPERTKAAMRGKARTASASTMA